MARLGQAWMQARQVWQRPGVCTALPFSPRMEPEGQTRWQMPQPTQSSVTRSRCCQASGGSWFIRPRNS